MSLTSSGLARGLAIGCHALFTAAPDGHRVLPESWITDGTPRGTWLLRDVAPGRNGNRPMTFTVFAQP